MRKEFKNTITRQKKKAFSLGYMYALVDLYNANGHVMLVVSVKPVLGGGYCPNNNKLVF